uniref:Uncharacterized protein n=1 Tax=viral metagenome TaxID=1070528 RepID=A0A6M3INE3_9ZZZZ
MVREGKEYNVKNIPERIYLQIEDDFGSLPSKEDDFAKLEEVTWCKDRINDSDIEYQRVRKRKVKGGKS